MINANKKRNKQCGFVMSKGKFRPDLPLVSGAVCVNATPLKSPHVLYKPAQYAIV
jgi:hypothetical protein